MNASALHQSPLGGARKLVGVACIAVAALCTPKVSAAQLIPGIKPPSYPAVAVLRINVDDTGRPDCRTKYNTVVAVVDDIVNNVVTVTFNGNPGSTTPTEKKYQSTPLEKIDLRFCGQSNSFRYELAANNPELSLPRTFRLSGGSSFDNVTLKFDSNAAGQPVTMTSAPSVDLRLGGLPSGYTGVDDSVEIRVRNIAGGTMDVLAKLGAGDDGFSFITYAQPMDGSLDLTAEGGPGHDTLWFDLWDSSSQVDIPAGSTVSIRASGDTLDTLASEANVADHGADLVQGGFRGTVDGTLVLEFRGDDAVTRTISNQCSTNGSCILFCQGIYCGQTTGLEAAMQEDSNYGSDLVQAQVEILNGSSGTVDVQVDGGLGTDFASLTVTNGNPPPSVLYGATFLQYSTTLSGGQVHGYKTDYCYASPVPSVTQPVYYPVAMSGCDFILPSLAVIQ